MGLPQTTDKKSQPPAGVSSIHAGPQAVKESHPDIEVVMLTGVVDVEVALQAIRMGASDYLIKPFNLEEVRFTIQKALEKRRLIQENREYQRNLETMVAARTAELVQ